MCTQNIGNNHGQMRQASHGSTLGTACPVDQKAQGGNATRELGYEGKLRGSFGIELEESSQVGLTGLSFQNDQMTLSFSNFREVQQLSGQDGCHADRRVTKYLEGDFELAKRGKVVIQLEGAMDLIGRAKKVDVKQTEFTIVSQSPAPPQGSHPQVQARPRTPVAQQPHAQRPAVSQHPAAAQRGPMVQRGQSVQRGA
jgi:hypothetical protein